MKIISYVEPSDYFPEELRKKYKLGEYHESNEKQERMGLKRFEFEWTGWFQLGEGLKISLIETDGKKFFEYKINMESSKVELIRETEFINNLEYFGVHEWAKRYPLDGISCLDGDTWSLEIEYNDMKVTSSGHCEYPDSFREMLNIFHEKWGMPYAGIEEIEIDTAGEIAQEYIGDSVRLTTCKETRNAYIFKDSNYQDAIGGEIPVFVLKRDGSIVGAYDYHEMFGAEETDSEYFLSKDGFWEEKE